MAGPAISIGRVSKRFRVFHERPSSLKERVLKFRRVRAEDFWALRDVTAEVPDGRTVGLVGPNGSGKTTLLKIIGGIIRPTAGRVVTRGRIAALLELGAGFHPELTGRENVYLNASILGLSKRETDRHFDDIVAFAELEEFIDNQVKHYSSGMFVRLGFAVAVHVDPDILLVDEVLAVGDEAFQRKCIARVRQFQREGRTIVFVTHAVQLIHQICDEALLLERGHLRASGDVEGVIRELRRVMLRRRTESREDLTYDMEIVGVELLDATGRRSSVLRPGDGLGVQVELRANRAVPGPVVGIAINDANDTHVFGTSTQKERADVERLEAGEKVRVTFQLPHPPLVEGRYHVTVRARNLDQTIWYDWHDKEYTFDVARGLDEDAAIEIPTEV
ncbi:MAG TPA: ABC transporter ATP-binding protein, partial [Actinomycetota bacterium]|nr:ABC transporter ATP-binding protein [Actinomycetota bacterium]